MAINKNEKYITFEALQQHAKNTIKKTREHDAGVVGGYNGSFPLTTATKGNIYLLPSTQKYYVCITDYNGSQLTVPNANFEELSVYANRSKYDNLIKVKSMVYGAFGDYREIQYPDGFTPENCNIIPVDTDPLNFGTCCYTLSTSKKQIKGSRLNGAMAQSNNILLIFIKEL